MRKMIFLIVVTSILLSSGCKKPINLPETLKQLYDYNWMVVQNESEPDVFRFYDNGRLYIFNYTDDDNCNWSFNDGKITISDSDQGKYNTTYTAEINSENNIMYLKLGNILLEVSKLKK